ncbi:uncharacterized protein LOC129310827 [Prosopis cineraria]|uniref:uncharacterized protein LOC129310827 n=1 Tax=Prosopis cineraria TaxID=364024 RepID=UPI00240EEE51|nr:uncharacterized protein LOC129310827 [Prosopis cineraria]
MDSGGFKVKGQEGSQRSKTSADPLLVTKAHANNHHQLVAVNYAKKMMMQQHLLQKRLLRTKATMLETHDDSEHHRRGEKRRFQKTKSKSHVWRTTCRDASYCSLEQQEVGCQLVEMRTESGNKQAQDSLDEVYIGSIGFVLETEFVTSSWS